MLDEPTAGLDPETAYKILEMLKRLQTEMGMTIVIVSHNMEEVAEFSDRVILMHKGEVLGDGCVSEVFSDRHLMDEVGLKVPLGVGVLKGLKNAGVNVDDSKHTQIDVYGELCKLL